MITWIQIFRLSISVHFQIVRNFDFDPLSYCWKVRFWSTYIFFAISILIQFQIFRKFHFDPVSNCSKFRFRFSLNNWKWTEIRTFRNHVIINFGEKFGLTRIEKRISIFDFLQVMKFQSLKMLLTFNINKLTKSL